ncbi:MAG: 3-hydroxybutyrate oligomer hydrolase family protein [Variovorax sp.]
MTFRLTRLGLGAAAACLAAGCATSTFTPAGTAPAWLTIVQSTRMDGQGHDLLTAGMGMAPLLGQSALPAYADPLQPTAAELRRAAIYSKGDPNSGYGTLFGPNIGTDGKPVADARIAGEEILAYADDGSGAQNVAMMLQIPAGFDAKAPCLLAVPTTGSARLYADLLRVGGWGLRRGCAVVYTDKGQANGFHELTSDTVNRIDGRTAPAAAAGKLAHFRAPVSDAERAAWLAQYPNRVAFKHAYSKQNPDATWGRDVVRAIEFALYALNQRFGAAAPIDKRNTTVIVTGNSNGGGAALLGGEADTQGLIKGIVAAQPQVQPRGDARVVVERSGRRLAGGGKSLLEYFTFAILYQPCAALATPDAPMAGTLAFAQNRCASLKDKGLLAASDLKGQAEESRQKLHAFGWEPGSDDQTAFHFIVAPTATANKYANSQGRFDVTDRLCGMSMASTGADGRPRPMPAAELANIFVTGNGGVPSASVDLINDRDPTGPRKDGLSVSASTGRQDYNLDGSLCLRDLVTGNSPEAQRVQKGIAELRATGDLHGIPTLILHGREDARVPANFSSRPYVGLNSLVEGGRGNLRYIEITHVNHFGWGAPWDATHIPLAYYEEEGLNLMWAHLKQGTPLPPSQVVRTTARGGERGKANPMRPEWLPAINPRPAAADVVSVQNGLVRIPD